jgi:dihydrofolate reductase
MRHLTADFFVSLDGFASGANGGQEWIGAFFGAQMTGFVQKVLAEPQILIVGRKTYQILFGYWPGSKQPEAGPMNRLPKVVFSRTLESPLAWNNARLARGDLADEILALKRQPGPPLRSIGSLELVRNMIELDLVDRLRLMVLPAVLGSAGKEPIFERYQELRLELVDKTVLDSNALVLEYRPAKTA